MNWFSIAENLGIITIIASVIAYLIRSIIKLYLTKDIEKYKAKLKHNYDVEIEKLKTDLNKIALEHQVKFTKLHEKRAEVIAETYSLLKELLFRLNDYVKPFEPAGGTPKEQRRKEAARAIRKFQDYYATRLIFLPKATAEKLEVISRKLSEKFMEFLYGVEMAKAKDSTEKWIEIFRSFQGEIKSALGDLEDEFRRLLGDRNEVQLPASEGDDLK